MRTIRITSLTVIGVALLDASAMLAAEKMAESRPMPPIWKTPDGVAVMVAGDDLCLAPDAISEGIPPAVRSDPAMVKDLTALMDRLLGVVATNTSATDPSYYDKGQWHFSNNLIACQGGPALMAAELWRWRQRHPQAMDDEAKARQPWLHQLAVDTFEHLIRDNQAPDGEIKNPGSHAWFVMSDFANTYLLLKESLDRPTRTRWLGAMKKEVEWFKRNGDIPNPDLTGWLATTWKASDGWYINGNVNLYQAETLYSIYLATGEPQYKRLFELEWRHTLSPSQKRWKGFGLFYLKMPTRRDGSNGAGFVTEKGEGDPGFDIYYTTLQLSVLGRLYVKSHDLRVLRVMNLLVNAELPHFDAQTLILNGTYGSRHHDIGLFCNVAPPVLAWLGGRTDFPSAMPDLYHKAIKPEYLRNAPMKLGNPGMYRGLGDLATLLQAAEQAER
jgi:hypothetical protein